MSQIKVAHVASSDISVRYMLFNQLLYLKANGYEVVGISAAGPGIEAVKQAGIRHIEVPMARRLLSPVADLKSLFRLYRVMRAEKFTIVHTHVPKAGILGRLAAKLAGVPIIVHTNHGFVFQEHSPWLQRFLFSALERTAARWADLLFAVNKEDIETARRYRIKEHVLLGPGGIGIDLSRFDPARISPESITRKRRELNLPEGYQVVGFVGRLVREKGLLELFEAARQLRRQISNVCFLFIGPVDEAKPDALRPETAGRYGIEDISYFTGLREDLPELYSIMDIFALPSHREGFPLSPMEASAMGTPSVVTNIRGCRQAVENGVTGYVVPVRDPQALATALLDLLRDREKRRRFGQAACAKALAEFDEQIAFRRVLAAYDQLLKNLKPGVRGMPDDAARTHH